jgi:hypothetical protein
VRDRDRITQDEVFLTQKYWQPWPQHIVSEKRLLTRGLWQGSSRDLNNLDRSVVRVGDWSIEVRLGAEVPYEAAVRILNAIRAGTLVDATEGGTYGTVSVNPYHLLSNDPRTIPRIERDANSAPDETGRYVIEILHGLGSGTILDVRIIGDRVEVLRVSRWIA